MTRCKMSNEKCSDGWEFDTDGVFLGRCECKIEEYKEVYFNWSGIPNKNKYKKTVYDLKKTFPIFLHADTKNRLDFKEEMKILIEYKDELLNNGIILLKGTPGSGKTQFATALAQSIFEDIDWDMEDNELKLTPYFFLSINEMMLNNVFFDADRLKVIQKKIRNSKILILDEFGDELNRMKQYEGQWVVDGGLVRAIDFLKEVLDHFNGLLILTTNNTDIEKHYIEKTGRMDVHSRLFGNIEKRENVLVYGFQFDEGVDLRDDAKREKMSALKRRFQ